MGIIDALKYDVTIETLYKEFSFLISGQKDGYTLQVILGNSKENG